MGLHNNLLLKWIKQLDREFENGKRQNGTIPNFGDFIQIKESDLDGKSIDILVGGTPCQGFSLAGLRKGLNDSRSGLAIEFLRLAKRLKPSWILWENVPGVLSSWSDAEEEGFETNDFDQFLAGMAEIGYGVSRAFTGAWIETCGK